MGFGLFFGNTVSMKVAYWENNRTEISKVLAAGQRKFEIVFSPRGPLRSLPAEFEVPETIMEEYVNNRIASFFLNVNESSEPVRWVIDVTEGLR
jgi:hypothetical protein